MRGLRRAAIGDGLDSPVAGLEPSATQAQEWNQTWTLGGYPVDETAAATTTCTSVLDLEIARTEATVAEAAAVLVSLRSAQQSAAPGAFRGFRRRRPSTLLSPVAGGADRDAVEEACSVM